MKKIDNIINKEDEASLEKNYYDACSDKDFKKYIDSLKLDDSVLMRYTSSLQDSFEEYKQPITSCQINYKGLYSEEIKNKIDEIISTLN